MGGDLFLIAENSSGDVIGSIIAGYDGHRGWLYAVAVAPEHRHQGIGSALVETACERLRVLGCNKVNLQIRSENASIGKFYRKLGFEEEPRISMGREI